MTAALYLGLALLVRDDSATDHDRNPFFAAVLSKGLSVGGKTVKLPEPTFRDGMTAEEQRAALTKVAGSARAVEELLHDSVSAPYILKVRDEPAEGATIRSADLFFAIRLDLDTVKPETFSRKDESGPIEAGNMRFEVKVLSADDLKGGPVGSAGDHEWFAHARGRLLDRIAVETTDRIVWSKTADSLVFASTTDPRFVDSGRWPNRWSTIIRKGNDEAEGPAKPFPGAVGYVKMTRWKADPKVAIVELHFAFAEPRAWFDGAPILRSKFSIVAQDQIRRLRRELVRKQG
jgi:hypothetical protein